MGKMKDIHIEMRNRNRKGTSEKFIELWIKEKLKEIKKNKVITK